MRHLWGEARLGVPFLFLLEFFITYKRPFLSPSHIYVFLREFKAPPCLFLLSLPRMLQTTLTSSIMVITKSFFRRCSRRKNLYEYSQITVSGTAALYCMWEFVCRENKIGCFSSWSINKSSRQIMGNLQTPATPTVQLFSTCKLLLCVPTFDTNR